MEQEPEIWKPIPGYEGLYEVSNHGRVKSLARTIDRGVKGKINKPCSILKQATKKEGYKKIILSKNNVRKNTYVHRLVAQCFLINHRTYKKVNHKDGDRSNNYFKNLEWVNQRENVTHGFTRIELSSKYPGVYLKKYQNTNKTRWASKIVQNKNSKHLGYFDTEEEAHQAYLDALKRYNIKNKYATKPPE